MKRLLTSLGLTLALLIAATGTVLAQDTTGTPIAGIVQSVAVATDATTGATTVTVTVLDDLGATQTVSLSGATAATLGLVTMDPITGETTVASDAVGLTVSIDPATVIGGTSGEAEKQHPVGSALADFFSGLLGVDYDTIMTYHEAGAGFGVIARALWFSHELGGGTDTFTALLDAKQSGDYSNITLADGSTPDNWGDVVKSMKKGDNLGSVRSGHAKSEADDTSTRHADSKGNKADSASTDEDTDNGGGSTENNANGHGNGGNSHGGGDGNGHGGGGNGHGHP